MTDMYMPNFPSDMGYGQNDLLAYLIAGAGGADSTDAGRALRLMMDPNFAALAGFFDPMQLQPQFEPQQFVPQYGKIVNSYLNDSDPLIATVAGKLVSGEYTPYAAQQALLNDGTFMGTSEDAKDLVDSIWKDYQSMQQEEADFQQGEAKRRSEADANDPFRKAGLPSVFDRYSAGIDPTTGEFVVNAPLSAATQSKFDRSTADYEAAVKELAAYKAKNKGYLTPDEMAGVRAAQRSGDPRPKAEASPRNGLTEQAYKQWIQNLRNDKDLAFQADYFDEAWSRAGGDGVLTWEELIGGTPSSGGNGWTALVTPSDSNDDSEGTFSPSDNAKKVWQSVLEKQASGGTSNAGVRDAIQGQYTFYTDKPATSASEKMWNDKVGTPWLKLKRAERQKGRSQAMAQAEADVMNQLGRTPLNDALRQRMAFVSMLLGGQGQ